METPRITSYSTSIDSNVVSVTIFEIFDHEIFDHFNDLELVESKAIQGQRS